MSYSTLAEATAAWPRRAPTDGRDCLWHRQHEFYLAHIVPLLPRCTFCGGEVDPRCQHHEMCRLRARDGRPTPRLSTVRACPCMKCSPRGIKADRLVEAPHAR